MSSSKICKHCKSEIDAKAKICPNCRKKQGSKLPIVIGGIAVIVIFAAVGGSGDDESPKKVGSTAADPGSAVSNVSNNDSNAISTDKTDESNAINKKTSSNEFVVGDIVETKDLQISFLTADDYETDNEFMLPADGNKYVKCEFEFNNISGSDQFVSAYDFECYADDYSCEQSYFDDLLSATISSGKKAKGAVYFEVPEDSKSIILEFKTNFWTEDKINFIVK